MKNLLFLLIFFSFFLITPVIAPAFAAVGAPINYTGLWRGSDGSRQGIDAGTLPANKKCTPKGYNFTLLCGPATESFETMNAAYNKETGKNLPVGAGYRTKEEQISCQNNGSCAQYNPNYPPAGHLWGTGIDFVVGESTVGSPVHNWLKANGPKYGWFWPLWAHPCSMVTEQQKKEGLCEGGGSGIAEAWHWNYYYVGYDINKYKDSIPDPFSGTSPGGGGGSSTAMACAVTKVGNAPGAPTLPAGCEEAGTGTGTVGPCGAVVDWGLKINNALAQGDGWDKLSQSFTSCGYTATAMMSGKYWCTFSVLDAYNLAGFKGLSRGKHSYVIAMQKWWKTAPGYVYVDYAKSDHKTALPKVKPGFAVFFNSIYDSDEGHEHVALVQDIKVDARGNGYLKTLDSNGGSKTATYPIDNWNVQVNWNKIASFGGH